MSPLNEPPRKGRGRAKAQVIMPAPAGQAGMPADYGRLLSDIKRRVAGAFV